MNRIKEMLSRKGIKQKLSSEQLVKNYELINSYVQNSKKQHWNYQMMMFDYRKLMLLN